MRAYQRLPGIIAFCVLASITNASYGNPITMEFSGKVLSPYYGNHTPPSWVGMPLSGSITIYPENFASEFSYFSPNSSQVYTFLGPYYGRYGNPVIDYSITLPDGSVFNAPHQGEYAEWGGITVHHQYSGCCSPEAYEVSLQIQPLDRSYQANFFFILENYLNDGTLVSSAAIDQIPNVHAATNVNAYLDVFDYRTFTERVNVRFSVDSIERQLPEPASWILVLTAAGALLVVRRRDNSQTESRIP